MMFVMIVIRVGSKRSSRQLPLIPKKVESLIQFFEPFWISRVFHFSLGAFGKVKGLPEPLGASDKIYTQSKIDISGSIETMQNAVASKVCLWQIFRCVLASL